MLRVVVGTALALVFAGAVPAAAHALTSADVAKFVVPESGAPAPSGMPDPSNVWSEAQRAEFRGNPSSPSSKAMHAELNKLQTKTGLMPKFASRLTTAGLAVGAFQVGFAVGTGINKKWLKVGIEELEVHPVFAPPSPLNMWTGEVKWRKVSQGESIESSPYSGAFFVASEDGLVIETDQGTWDSRWARAMQRIAPTESYTPEFYPANQCGTYPQMADAVLYPPPVVRQWVDGIGTCQWWPDTWDPPSHIQTTGLVQWVPESALDKTLPEPFESGTHVPDVSVPSWDGQPSSYSSLVDAIGAELMTNRSAYQHLIDWLENEKEAPTGTTEVPDCRGMTRAACIELLRAAGLHGTITTDTLEWDTANTALGPNVVVKTTPQRGSRIDKGGNIVITRNPLPEHMPVYVPELEPRTPRPEIERPFLDRDLDIEWVYPETPEEGTCRECKTKTPTVPAPGTKVPRGGTVTIEINPPDAPDVPTGGPPSDLDFTPLKGIPDDFCNSFPFGVPCYMVSFLDEWSAVGEAPSWELPILNPFDGGTIEHVTLDLAPMEPVVTILKPIFVIIATFFIVLFWGRLSVTGNPEPQGGGGEE